MASRAPLFRECLDNARPAVAVERGQVLVDFEIAGDPDVGGVVVSSELVEDKSIAVDPATRECIQETIYAARFPPPEDNGDVRVQFAFAFGPADGAKAAP